MTMRFNAQAYDRAFPRSEVKPIPVPAVEKDDEMVHPAKEEVEKPKEEVNNGTPRTDESPTE